MNDLLQYLLLYQHYVPLILIPLCSLLNHLGGQSTEIPDPRFFCRMIGQGLALGIVSFLSGIPLMLSGVLGAVGIAGFTLWAVWKWGPGFMAVTGVDTRGTDFLCRLTDKIYNSPGVLSPAQCYTWGTIYMTIRGTYLYPLFAALGYLLTPWFFLIGLSCLLQGVVYRLSGLVLRAEYIMGGTVIGSSLASGLMIYLRGL